jgi:hypothetical protein
MKRFVLSTLLMLLGASAQPALGQTPFASLHERAATLRPGEYAWGDAVADGAVTVAISVTLQRLYVYRGDTLVGVSAISTGRPGKDTPHGEFRILQKAKWHRSNLYSNAPMPFMQRLTWDGIALHAGYNPGYPASHGCIRLPAPFARALFEMTTLGSTVSVSAYPLEPPVWLHYDELELAMADRTVVGGGRNRPIRLDYAMAVFAYE